MSLIRPPYWSWRHDRLKLVIAVGLAAVALFLALRPPAVVAPTITAPAAGAVLDAAAPGEMMGTAAPGAVIAVFDGETLLGTTTAAADGTWRFALPPLPEGLHDLSARILDARGRVVARADLTGIRVEAVPVVIATPVPPPVIPEATLIPPTAPPVEAEATPVPPTEAPVVTPAEVTPISPAETPVVTLPVPPTEAPVVTPPVAPEVTPTLAVGAPIVVSGFTRPGAVVTVSEGETVLAQVTADEQGGWRVELTDLSPGRHELTVTVTNAEGKPVEAPQTLAVVIVPPVTPAETPAVEVTPVETPTMEVTPAETPAAEATPAETPTAEATPAETPAAEVTPPAPTLAPVPATLANSRPTLTGTAPPRSHVTVFDGNRSLGQAIADAHGNWHFVPRRRLAPGEHTLRVEILPPGAAEAAVFTVTVTVAPDARPLPPPTIQTPRRHRLGVGSLLRGTAPPQADLRLLADETAIATFKAGPRGGWAVRLPATLTAGSHTFRLEVLGPDGVVLAVSAAVVIEVINPGPPTTLPVTGGVNGR